MVLGWGMGKHWGSGRLPTVDHQEGLECRMFLIFLGGRTQLSLWGSFVVTYRVVRTLGAVESTSSKMMACGPKSPSMQCEGEGRFCGRCRPPGLVRSRHSLWFLLACPVTAFQACQRRKGCCGVGKACRGDNSECLDLFR